MPIINMVYKKKKWWKPWANTIAYYPLTENANDYSGNGYNGTAWSWVSFTNMWTLKYASFNWTSNWKISLPWFWTPSALTTSIWVKTTVTWTWKIFWGLNSPSNNANLYFSIENWNIALTMWNGSSDNRVTWSTINDGNWHNVIWVFWGWELKIYVDGTYISNTSTSVSALNNNNWAIGWWVSWNGIVCSLSENIIENVQWTAQEVANYYNQTKANYWL